MEEAIIKVGLPVKCAKCHTRGFVRPHTDYGGWTRLKRLRAISIWYCPDDADAAVRTEQRANSYQSPKSELSTEDELYKLLD